MEMGQKIFSRRKSLKREILSRRIKSETGTDKENTENVDKNLILRFEKGNKDRIWGIDMLKIIMCFGVITCHFWDADMSRRAHIIMNTVRSNAVHSFVLVAFYFSAKTIESKDWNCIMERIIRLLRPFLIWPIIMIILYNLTSLILHGSMKYGLRNLGAQYFMGHTEICGVMYFNWILMVLTVFFAVVFCLLPKRGAFLFLISVSVWTLFFVYTGGNFALFSKFPYEMRYPLGRLSELYPTAFIGLVLSHIDFDSIRIKMKNAGIWGGFYCVTGFEIIWMCFISPTLIQYFPEGQFGYGYPYHIILAVWFFVVAIYAKGDRISAKIRRIISEVGHYTVGIYCVHIIVGQGMEYFLGRRTLRFCVLCFMMCLFVVYGMSKLPWKWCKEITQ